MNFRIKCAIQTVFSVMPNGTYLNYLCQKHITHTMPPNFKKFQELKKRTDKHLEKFNKYSPFSINDVDYYEFGAGWDLINSIVSSQAGFRQLYCIDIRKLVFPELLNNTAKYLSLDIPNFSRRNYNELLQKHLRICYRAPIDARKTTFNSNSFGFIASNETFEHIPQEDLLDIVTECYRILKPGGIFSCLIDYKDHWSYNDESISCYNFLKFKEKEWKKYNASFRFQNRLRHNDYKKMFTDCGFKILEENCREPVEEDIKTLSELSASTLESLHDIGIKEGWFVLQKL